MKFYLVSIFLLLLISCHFKNNLINDTLFRKDSSIINDSNYQSHAPKDAIAAEKEEIPVINVEPTLVRPNLYLVMQDNSETEEESHHKLKQIFSNLLFILKRNNLEPVGEPVAWHTKRGNLFVVEGGVPLEKKLSQLEPGTNYKETKRCAAAVAHFFGKRKLLTRAYDSLYIWLKDNHKEAKGEPWEVYVDDPHVMKDPNFMQTDVYIETY